MKRIELKGVGTNNKGAYLMLESILQKIKQQDLDVVFCTQLGFGMLSKDQKNLGFHNKLIDINKVSFIKHKVETLFFSLFSENYRATQKKTLDKDIDFILDASGFAYGDFWGEEVIKHTLHNVLNNKIKSNTKVILLPQAFGPFTNKKVTNTFKKAIDKIDLIFARDKISYEHLINTFGENEKFSLAPDFTNILDAGNPQEYAEGDICIIPNVKMLKVDEEDYMNFLKHCATILKAQNEKFYFLIHEGYKDKEIAEKINADLQLQIPIVNEFSAIKIKNRIKSSKLIIVSRFHGLVSGLSQGIPVISTSWSHKYEMLLEDYSELNSLITINNYKVEGLKNLIEKKCNLNLIDYKKEKKKIIDLEKTKTKDMWAKVFDLIE